MSPEQIEKLRRIILGFEKMSAFSENEIHDLEDRAGLTLTTIEPAYR